MTEPVILDRTGRPIMALPQKAVTGAGVTALTYSVPLWSMARTPQQKAYQAAMLYHTNYLIRLAERPVSTRGGSVDWHLETADEQRVGTEEGENADPALLAVRDLLEKPQAALPADQKQPGMTTRRGMWTTTLRHTGLCGTTFWYLDQTDPLAGTPLAILYIAPWRLFEVRNRADRLIGWTLDRTVEDGGTPLDMANVLPFYLEPPDQGYWAVGLIEAAGSKAMLDPLIDRHIAGMLGAGGRLTGLLSPKVGSVITEDQWKGFINDWRAITSDPAAAQRLQIVQGPVDWVRTAATPDELSLVEIDERTRDAVLALWGVPRSQVGIAQPAGLNSGDTKSYDEAVLWQGAIHPRLASLYETIQFGLLDRYKALGIAAELILDEPSFDDDAPLYAKAVQSVQVPLTVAERREIVGKEPFGENIRDERGRIIDQIVLMPIAQAETFYASETLPSPEPAPAVTVLPPPPVPQLGPGEQPMAKAVLTRFAALRRSTDALAVPRIKRAVLDFLGEQKTSVTRYLRAVGLEHLRRKHDFRWDARAADRQLEDVLKPHLGRLVARVAARTHAALAPGKAAVDDFTEKVLTRVLTKGAGRVTNINTTTRRAIQEAIEGAIGDANTIDDIITAVNDLEVFGELRAETIARTESMFAYNSGALGSYAELGVEQVQAIDGDQDEICAERDGQVFSIEEAEGIEDHPNGTLDFLPIVPDEPVEAKSVTWTSTDVAAWKGLLDFAAAQADRPVPPPPIVNVEPTIVPAPVVTVDTSTFVLALDELRQSLAAPPRTVHKRVVRDAEGRILEVIEEIA